MDFIDEIKQFSERVLKMKDNIPTEEATKMSLIVPFFQILGYDVFNPNEFLPEYTADVGIKKGEKVDYAIVDDGNPVILVECKWCGEDLDKHSSQLFRYFGTSKAKFGILTNGISYNFYTDLDETNKMDLSPFLEFSLLDIKPNLVTELKKFSKTNFDAENIFSTASELKYSKAIKQLFADQLKEPTDDLVKFILSGVYDGIKTQNVIDKYRGVVKKSLNDYINELMNERISSALNKEHEPEIPIEEAETEIIEEVSKIVTTEEEIESFYIIKSLLVEIAAPEDISYKDNERYFSILYKDSVRKTICRVVFGAKTKQLLISSGKDYDRYYIVSTNDIYSYKEQLITALKELMN